MPDEVRGAIEFLRNYTTGGKFRAIADLLERLASPSTVPLTARCEALPTSPVLYDETGRLKPAVPIPLSDAPDRPSAVPDDEVREVAMDKEKHEQVLAFMCGFYDYLTEKEYRTNDFNHTWEFEAYDQGWFKARAMKW